jgi:N-acetylmuramoyl-L-alanine amidase
MSTLESYEKILVALCIWREARGEITEAKLGVWWVIRNRKADSRWPNTMAGVVLQPRQFSSFNAADPNSSKLPAPEDPAFVECCGIVDSPGLDDPTLGANSYHSFPPGYTPLPSWADPNKLTTRIGAFSFYRL